MIKPASIIKFDRLYLAALVLGAVNFAVGFSSLSDRLAQIPEYTASGFGTGILIASFIAGLAINLLIWFFISVRASKVAKWILVALFAIGLVQMVRSFGHALGPQGFSLAVTLVITGLQAAAIYMLFRPDALSWFNRNPPVDPDTFH